MELSPDELAGIADLFGGLTRAELCGACVELAYKAGDEREPAEFEPVVADAVASYHLVAVERDDAELLVPGPVAFPELPAAAEDLPHILDIETRAVDPEARAEAAETRFRADAARAVEAGDAEAIAELLDVSYELDVWAPVDLGPTRDRLDAALEE